MSGEGPNEQNGLPQDDIDALLNAAGGAEASAEPAEASNAPSEASSAPADAPETPPAPETPDVSAEGQPPASTSPQVVEGGLGPDQIEALAAAASDPPASPGDGAEFSQGDIDAIMAAEGTSDQTPAEGRVDAASEGVAAAPKLDTAGRPFDEAAALMEAAIAEERAGAATVAPPPPAPAYTPSPAEIPPPPPNAMPLELPDFNSEASMPAEKGIELLNDVDLDVKIELGRAQMLIEDVLKLGEGSVIELDKLAGDPVDVLVNERLVARGEVLILNDSFCVRISEIVPGVGGDEAPNVG